MPQGNITFNVLPYVPNRFVWAFAFLLVTLYALVQWNFWLLGISLLAIAVCLTTQYRVELNINEKWFKEFVWVLGVKHGEPVQYSNLEYLYINKGKVTQTTGSRVQTITVTKDEYRGFIKFDGAEKIHILTNSNHPNITKDMIRVAQSLHVKLFDYSSGQTVQVT